MGPYWSRSVAVDPTATPRRGGHRRGRRSARCGLAAAQGIQVDLEVEHRAVSMPCDRYLGVDDDTAHGVVLGEYIGDQVSLTVELCHPNEFGQQRRAHSAIVLVVGDEAGDLGLPGLLGCRVVCHADEFAVVVRTEGDHSLGRFGLRGGPIHDTARMHGEEPEIALAVAEGVRQRNHGIEVRHRQSTYVHHDAVPQGDGRALLGGTVVRRRRLVTDGSRTRTRLVWDYVPALGARWRGLFDSHHLNVTVLPERHQGLSDFALRTKSSRAAWWKPDSVDVRAGFARLDGCADKARECEMSSTPSSSDSKQHGVVVAVDGSPASRVAVDWAARDAELRGVPLTVVHVIPPVVVGAWTVLPVSSDFWVDRHRRAEQIVTEALGWVSDAI